MSGAGVASLSGAGVSGVSLGRSIDESGVQVSASDDDAQEIESDGALGTCGLIREHKTNGV